MQIVCAACGTTNRVPDERLKDQPVCGKCGAALLPEHPVALSDATFANFIARTEWPVLVDFWADWCGPCKSMAPQFALAASQLSQVRFAKLDTERHPQSSAASAIRNLPTVILYRAGRELARQSGVMTASALLSWVRSQLAPRG